MAMTTSFGIFFGAGAEFVVFGAEVEGLLGAAGLRDGAASLPTLRLEGSFLSVGAASCVLLGAGAGGGFTTSGFRTAGFCRAI